MSQNQSLFARYMLTTTFWEPALKNTPDNILAAGTSGSGGRDSYSQSLAFGYTQVLSSTTVNNVRFTANQTNVHRTNADMFEPRDVGINIYTYVPKYTVMSITGAFGVNFGTETDSWYRPTTYGFSRSHENPRQFIGFSPQRASSSRRTGSASLRISSHKQVIWRHDPPVHSTRTPGWEGSDFRLIGRLAKRNRSIQDQTSTTIQQSRIAKSAITR